jgi:hypothetical protein
VAAVSARPRPQDVARQHQERYLISPTALTDGASNVFAPGWDVSYGRDSFFSYPYYNTAGLGSPFVEDSKLCAAANGMWAAASPDASRTFHRVDTPTAIPLTDEELGIHPSSLGAAVANAGRGWDGGYGPFFEMVGPDLTVNYADIMRADLVSNALRNLMRFDLLRQVSRHQMVERMTALSAAVRALDGDAQKVAETKRWLVVFREIGQWGALSIDSFMPAPLSDTKRASEQVLRTRVGGGIVLGFVQGNGPELHIESSDRLRTVVAEVNFVGWDRENGITLL